MKHAILITAYKNFKHLLDIIDYFDDDFEVFIHIDRCVKLEPEEYQLLQQRPNVKFISQKYKIYWGSVNHLRSIVLLCREALKNKDIGYIHTISGCDYPIKNIHYFKSLFQNGVHREYICFFKLPSPVWYGGLCRYEYYYLNDWVNIKTKRGNYISGKCVEWQRKLKLKRVIPSRFLPLYGGNIWWSLSRDCVEFAVANEPLQKGLLKRLRLTYISEEVYFQTLIMKSPWSHFAVDNNLRYIDWNFRNQNNPANLDLSDFEKILESDGLFARKFEFPVSASLLDKLKETHCKALSVPPDLSPLELLQTIAEKLTSNCLDYPAYGLLYGKIGIALFLFYYAEFCKDKKYEEVATELLVQVQDQLENMTILDYSSGISGIGVGIMFLLLFDFIEGDADVILEDIDEIMKTVTDKILNDNHFVKLNNQYKLDKYFNYRVRTGTLLEKGPLDNNGYLDKIMVKISDHPVAVNSLSIDSYTDAVNNTLNLGIKDGYARVGLQILSDVYGMPAAWKELLD